MGMQDPAAGRGQIRLLLVDDHQVVRLGLCNLFGTVPGFTIVAEAGTAAEAVAKALSCHPDVVLMDMRLPDGSGADACRQIRLALPGARVLILTSYDDREAVEAALLAGATGYVMKESTPDRLIQAVVLVAEGRLVYDPVAAQAVLEWAWRVAAEGQTDTLSCLREQERQILALIAKGMTNREIATSLYLSEHTVKAYISGIFRKLRVSHRSEAAALMARRQ